MWKFEQVHIYEMVINEFDNRYNIIVHTKKANLIIIIIQNG